ACGVKYTGMVNILMTLIVLGAMIWLRIRSWEAEEISELDREYEANRRESDDSRAMSTAVKKDRVLKKRTDSTGKKRNRKKFGDNNNSLFSKGQNGAGPASQPDLLNGYNAVTGAQEVNHRPEVGFAKGLGIVVLWAVIIASPWYIQSIVLFGNPFFPFYENIFGGLGIGILDSMRPSLAVDHSEMLKYFKFEPTIRNILELPWNFTFHNNGPWLWQDVPAPIGPFYLALAPAFLFVKKWRRVGIFLIIYLYF
ncbi:MAG: hypothetical protein ABIC40_06575, partial [bacterium]